MAMEHNENNIPKFDITSFLYDLWRSIKHFIVLGLTLMVICSAGIVGWRYWRYVPMYQASVSFNIQVANPLYARINSYNLATADQMAKTFPYILTSGVLQKHVTEHLGISSMPSVKADVLPSTNIFSLSVRDADPQKAYDVLNAVIEYYPEVAEFVVGPTTMILLDESGVPTKPINPFNIYDSIKDGVIIGAVLWLTLALLHALTRTTVRNESELKKVISFPCLGQLPATKTVGKGNSYALVGNDSTKYGFNESVRLLRMHVEKQMKEQNKRILLVSSAIPGEGKTTVSANLAASLAQKGKRVLLVDCDMRNPSVAKVFNIANKNGLAEYLDGQINAREVLRVTSIPNLFVIVGGVYKRNITAELMSQDKAKSLIEATKSLFDYVILDTPPCSLLADAAEVAELAECALIVIRQDFASRNQILDGAQFLTDSKLPVIGCVFNGTENRSSSYYGGYDYYGYNYGYSYGNSYGNSYGDFDD